PFYSSQIKDLLQVLIGPLTEIDYKINVGQYNGKPEKTMVVNYNSSHSREQTIKIIKEVCGVCTQECIPVKCGTFAELVYHPDYTGEKYKFDPQYFINF